MGTAARLPPEAALTIASAWVSGTRLGTSASEAITVMAIASPLRTALATSVVLRQADALSEELRTQPSASPAQSTVLTHGSCSSARVARYAVMSTTKRVAVSPKRRLDPYTALSKTTAGLPGTCTNVTTKRVPASPRTSENHILIGP